MNGHMNDEREASAESESSASSPAGADTQAERHSQKAKDRRSKSNRARDLGNESLDPSRSARSDPESWDERPEFDDGEYRYTSERPPHHGD